MRKVQHVYFICDKRKRYVKIGVSAEPEKRLIGLSGGSPLPLKLDLCLYFDGQGALSYEDALHQYFAEYWRHGEWFNYGPSIKEFVKKWKDGEAPILQRPDMSCKQWTIDETGACFTKSEVMTILKERTVQQ